MITEPPFQQDHLIELTQYYVNRIDRQDRCTIPTTESFNMQFEAPKMQDATLIAMDGSQSEAPPNSLYEWKLVNLACTIWDVSLKGNGPIRKQVRTELYIENYKAGKNGRWQEVSEHLDLVRDTSERLWLADCGLSAKQHNDLVICLLDNPLEFWGARSEAPGKYEESKKRSEAAYKRLTDAHIPFAGLVASAKSTLFTRMIEVAQHDRNSIKSLRHNRSLYGLKDYHLLGSWLKPGNRSAVFRLGGRASGLYEGELALHTFYINVSQNEAPVIMRVEVPAWVALDQNLVGQLHSHLLYQSHLVKDIPYPHILTLADRACRILPGEKSYVDRLLRMKMRSIGIVPPAITGKMRMKWISRRRRRK